MSGILLCNEPASSSCRDQFRLRASNWIDGTNVGQLPGGVVGPPPAGIRLRWNTSFLAAAVAQRGSYPTFFVVKRGGPIAKGRLLIPFPNAGHTPRTFAPRSSWHSTIPASDMLFLVDRTRDPCIGAQAIYFELDPGSPAVTASLFDLAGNLRVCARIEAGARFYYEVTDLVSVQFSTRPVLSALPISLALRDLNSMELAAVGIAQVDARIWTSLPLQEVARRLSRNNGDRFISITEAQWDLLRRKGDEVIAAHDNGIALQDGQLDFLRVSSALKWEASLLMGWGFLDGEHPPGPGYDRIDEAAMMPAPSGEIFAYEVEAHLPASRVQPARVEKSCFLTRAALMPSLSRPILARAGTPVVEARMANTVDPGPRPDDPRVPQQPKEKTFCRMGYELDTDNIYNERINTTPMASDSEGTGDRFDPAGSFSSQGNGPRAAIMVEGLYRRDRRDYDFAVPFYDSHVWLEIAVGDYWDRYLPVRGTDPMQPDIRYHGQCIPIATTTCSGKALTATLEFSSPTTWRADKLARMANGRIEALERREDVERIRIAVEIGSPFLEGQHVCGAFFKPSIGKTERDRLIGGTIEVDTFSARITGFRQDRSSAFICLFELAMLCGVGSVFPVQNGWAAGWMSESEGSEWLWARRDDMGIDPATGMPEKYSMQLSLDPRSHSYSRTLWFATRMALDFRSHRSFGPITPPVAAPYLAAPPPAPDLCVRISYLGNDYYDRAIMRIVAEDCDHFDPAYRIRIVCAADDDQMNKLTNEAGLAARHEKGIFSPQQAFRERVVFEGFQEPARTPDGKRLVFGISNVRPQDGSESPPLLRSYITTEQID